VSTPPLSLFAGALVVLRKDLLIEWRTRARLNALLFFALVTLLLFALATDANHEMLQRNAAGYLWLAVLFASVLSLGESFRVESENAAMDGLRLAPCDPRSIFLGKAIGNTVLLSMLALILLPVMIALYDVSVALGFAKLLLVVFLGAAAISAPGTVHAAVASNARAKDVLLPVLLFPLLVPALLSSVRATAVVLGGDPMHELGSWMGLLAGFNLVYWGLGVALFPRIVED
jgi:heme exporter protein B